MSVEQYGRLENHANDWGYRFFVTPLSNNRFARHFNRQATPYPTHPPVPTKLAYNKMKIVELILYNKFYCNNIFYVNFV